MLLPVFVLFSSAGNYLGIAVIGTRWGLFIAYLTFALPFSTWVMVTYLRGLPRELEEAAPHRRRLHREILFRIIFPLSLPAIVVSGDLRLPARLERRAVRLRDDPAGDADGRRRAVQVFGATQEGGAMPVYSQVMAAALVSRRPWCCCT